MWISCFPPIPVALAVAVALGSLAPSHADAQTSSALVQVALKPMPLAQALNALAHQADIQISFPADAVAGKMAPAVSGKLTANQALHQLLGGTGLEASVSGNLVTVRPAAANSAASLPEITVASSVQDAEVERVNPRVAVGSKVALAQRDIPNSVSVITQQQMREQSATSVDDVMRYAPGVSVLYVNPNDTTYLVRGFPITTFQFDGVPTALPQSGAGMVADSVAMYDRVEVLRGPSGLFNGFGGDGGTINLVRKKAPSTFQASADLSVGTYADRREQVDLGGPLNQAGTLRGRLVAMQHNQHLMQDSSWQADQQLYATLEADVTSGTTVRIGASQTKQYGRVMYGIPAYTDYTVIPLPRSQYLGADFDRLSVEKKNAFVELEQKLPGDWTAKFAYNHVRWNQHFLNGIIGGYIEPVTMIGNQYSYNYEDRNTQDAVDLYASGPFRLFGRKHQLTIGANYLHQVDQSNQYFINPASGLDIWGDFFTTVLDNSVYSNAFAGGSENDYRTVTNQFGLYGNARLSITDPLTLVIGGRMTKWNSTLTPDADPNHNEFGQTYRHESTTPKYTPFVGLVYDLDGAHSAYASYTSIYKPQTSYFAFGGDMIKPVTGDQYEVGLKGEYFDRKLNASVALFRIDESNRAFEDPAHPGFYLASGKARSQGVELTASGEVRPGLTLSTGYTYARVRPLDESVTSTAQFSYQPKHQFKAWANYRLPGQWEKVSVGGGVVTSSKTYYADGTNHLPAGGYTSFDARMSYQISKNLSASLSVTNLFDKVYWASVSTGGGSYYGNPRKVLLNVSAKL